jgi:hypothetical protein
MKGVTGRARPENKLFASAKTPVSDPLQDPAKVRGNIHNLDAQMQKLRKCVRVVQSLFHIN